MWRILFLAIIFLVAACKSKGESIAELAAEHRDDIEARYSSLRAIAERLDEIPLVTENAYAAVDPEPTIQPRELRDDDRQLLPYNTAVLHEEHLALLDSWQRPDLAVELGSAIWITSAWRTIEKIEAGEEVDEGDDRDRERLEQVARLRYAVVVRTHRARAPVVTGENSFDSGFLEGEALVFTLDGGEHLGGFRFAAQNDEQVRAFSSLSDMRLENNLKYNARDSLQAGLAQYAQR